MTEKALQKGRAGFPIDVTLGVGLDTGLGIGQWTGITAVIGGEKGELSGGILTKLGSVRARGLCGESRGGKSRKSGKLIYVVGKVSVCLLLLSASGV